MIEALFKRIPANHEIILCPYRNWFLIFLNNCNVHVTDEGFDYWFEFVWLDGVLWVFLYCRAMCNLTNGRGVASLSVIAI